MATIFNKFRKSSQSDARSRRSASTNSTSGPLSDDDAPRTSTAPSPSPSRRTGASGSLFVEDLAPPTTPSSNNNTVTSSGATESRTPNRPGDLSVPNSAQQQPLGTPKFTLTQDGSNSPRSFDGSPVQDRSPAMNHDNGSNEPVGLGFGKSNPGASDEDDLETPTLDSSFPSTSANRVSAVSIAADPSSRERASSLAFSEGNVRSRSGSMVSRITNRHGPASPNSLMPDDQKGSVSSKKSRKKRDRRRSVTSTASGQSSLAALARGGLQMAGPGIIGDELHIKQHKGRRATSPLKRSPYLTRGEEGDGDELDDEYGEGLDDDDDDDSDLEDTLSVLGYAVASNRRNADFHQVFPSVDEGDYLIDDYGCAYAKDILVQGRAYISENYICFHANIFGWTTDLVIPFTEIKSIEKKMTALVIPNAIGINTATARYTFASFISRDTVYDVMMNIWRLCNPNAVMSSLSLPGTNNSRPASISGELADAEGDAPSGPSAGQQIAGASVKGAGSETHKPTQCACGKDGKHYPEIALEATFPSTPEKVYNLMFNSGWLKTFLSDSQQLRDIEYSDWRTGEGSDQLTRSLSYIKPLNGSIGPKQTTCHITDSRVHFEPEEYIAMVTTTRTPDVPSGGVFSVMTRTCFMWAGGNSTKVVVTTGVEWTGKSWIKGIIEKSAIDGQKTYHDDLKLSMLSYIQSHISEFLPPGAQASVDTPVSGTPAAEVAAAADKQTEAQEYAKKARKDRQEQDWGMVQAGVDSLVAGGKGVVSGFKFCVDGLSDLIFPSGLSKQSVTTLVIIVLVISNVWTYIAFSGGQQRSFLERRSAKRGNDEVAEAVKMVLGQRRDPVQEAQELVRVLDFVERRLGKLREEAKELGDSAVRGGENNGEDLD
ncbi:hypothetical protein I350_01195 [Cryptococcus amylolentus CBS 6273]|uniref:VASt domain-containing protein n=1 Tax=Cryptococcus amylolentus CBS 6273 TaxID=1296118 RepID=A0A1E3KBY0_9TREE|nr:hypothetical protein I350_01195 [Cryptococcus amylolentus CBS 6273]